MALLAMIPVVGRWFKDEDRFLPNPDWVDADPMEYPVVCMGDVGFAAMEVGTIYYARDTARFWLKKGMPNEWECLYDVKREGSHLHGS